MAALNGWAVVPHWSCAYIVLPPSHGSSGKGEKATAGLDGDVNNKTTLPIANLVRVMKKVGVFQTLVFDHFTESMTTYIHGYRGQFERTDGNIRVQRQAPLLPGAPPAVTFTGRELQFLRSVIPSPSDEDGCGYDENR
ncbi:hypothetical protein GUJ93_ZPchr0002g26165 [Zizania palustris]|uniref:Uncharacterized protein n=1 Tax=Zizania palustris TaxID=103762 RepID=A0A8J5SAY1_ZIZPA|nr:hypothetical protein GUJ93_ZPchr0002g26165 [Zizania palustris]